METNEQIRRELSKALEAELETFLKQVSQMTEGELKHLEEQVVKSSQAIGRKLMEGVLNSRLHEHRPAARRQGRCGHRQRLVGERSKQLITLVGPVRFVRAYYQCFSAGEVPEEQDCRHGEAPADVLWGVDKQRTTPGVQGHISYLSARLTFEEAAKTLCRTVPIGMGGAPSPQPDASGGRSVGGSRRAPSQHHPGPGQAGAEPAVCTVASTQGD
ncbi:MAG: hypothetical protein ABI396_01080 [Ktedonobacteraceae bacterium]